MKIGPRFQFAACNIGAEWAKNVVSWSGAVSGCEKNWLEREVAERGTRVTEIDLRGEWKFSHSCSAHRL